MKKEHNPAIPYVDSKHYHGDCRRHQQNLPRVPLLVPASVDTGDPNKSTFHVKVTNIGHGGCKFCSHDLINHASLVTMTFYIQRGHEFTAATPITGRIVHVHKKGEFYYVNCDFRGALHHEHGIQEIIDANMKPVVKEELNKTPEANSNVANN